MKIVIFSDIHGNKYAFDTFLMDIKKIKYDKIVFCGDVFGYYYFTDEIAKTMIAEGITCLLGNHDKMLLDIADGKYSEEYIRQLSEKYGSVYLNIKTDISDEAISHLRSLQTKYILAADGLKIGFFHGTPDNPLDGRLYPDSEIISPQVYSEFDFVFLGHTHHKMVRNIGKTVVINPGSLGQQRDGCGCSYVIFDTALKKYDFHVVQYNRKVLTEDIKRYDGGNLKLTEVLFRKKAPR